MHYISQETKNGRAFIKLKTNSGRILEKRVEHFLKCKNIEYTLLKHKTQEDFINDSRIKSSIEILGEYKGWNKPVLCKCKICGYFWSPTPNKLLGGRGCPNCNIIRMKRQFTKTNQCFQKELKEKNTQVINIEEYQGVSKKIKFKCLLCGYEFYSTPDAILHFNSHCPSCYASIGEKKILLSLKELEIKFITQKTFSECKDNSKGRLRFDFYLPELNVCIEFQGEQHFAPIIFCKEQKETCEENYTKLKKRDQIKREFCKNKKIRLIEIPFWEREKISNVYIKKLLFD